jgi:uncharacterized protein YjbI with pentapeptide repeats
LRSAVLSGAGLNGAFLSGAVLSGALSGTYHEKQTAIFHVVNN